MTLAIPDAEVLLRSRLGEPVKPSTDYVVGFTTPSGKVLAIHREATETRIWFQPPEPPGMDGVRLMDGPSNGNSNINGPLLPLRAPTTLRVEVDSPGALNRFLDWYAGAAVAPSGGATPITIDPLAFREAFERFQSLIAARSGHPFATFNDGLAAAWESYKPRLRDRAVRILGVDEWSENMIGSGQILQRTIDAIEIQTTHGDETNNLVGWTNRWGHAARDHRVLLEATVRPLLRKELEALLFGLYRGNADEAATFERLSNVTGTKYPLLAYLFFLKDIDRFMPINPTGFDRVFAAMGIPFRTLRNCSWQNYATFNAVLASLRPLLREMTGLRAVRLIDAHSYCWILTTLLKDEEEGSPVKAIGKSSDGRVVGGWERSIIEMRTSILNTVRNSNGQIVERLVKDKHLLMDPSELDDLLRARLDLQGGKCNLTGIAMHSHGPDADPDLLPSPDRIDNDRQYELENIQVVCRFINFWKGSRDNAEFQRLLMMVRGLES